MLIGLQVPHFRWGSSLDIAPRLAEIANAAEEAGFASLWVMDHFFPLPKRPVDDPVLECHSVLGFLSAVTRNIRLGTLVTGVTYRHPGVLIKTISTLDVLSQGRITLGIGAGWYEREAYGLGIPFPPTRERFEMLEETLKIAHQMWSGTVAPFGGKHYNLHETLDMPLPVRKPRPPILIGGSGRTKMLRLVARYANACNLVGISDVPQVRDRFDALRETCDKENVSYDSIERTVLESVHLEASNLSASQMISHCHELAAIGVQHVIFNFPDGHELSLMEQFAREIMPHVSER